MMDFDVMFEPRYDLYQVAVFQSRYSGIYEGGEWFAIANFESFDETGMSEYVFGDDCDAVDFWMSEKSEMIGMRDNAATTATKIVMASEFFPLFILMIIPIYFRDTLYRFIL